MDINYTMSCMVVVVNRSVFVIFYRYVDVNYTMPCMIVVVNRCVFIMYYRYVQVCLCYIL